MLEPSEIDALRRLIKFHGTKMVGANIMRATLPMSGVSLRMYPTQRRPSSAQSNLVIQDEAETWFLVLRALGGFYYAGNIHVHLSKEAVKIGDFELRGDEAQFMQDMTMCRMFDELRDEADDDHHA